MTALPIAGEHASNTNIEYCGQMHLIMLLMPKSRKNVEDDVSWKSNLDQHHWTSFNKVAKQVQHWISKDVEAIHLLNLLGQVFKNRFQL